MAQRWWLVLLAAETLASAFPARAAVACDTNAWRHSLTTYAQEHPRAEAADLYKFVHQGIMGSEHFVTDAATADAWMQRELATLSKYPGKTVNERTVERLPPNGRFVRVNLRPFLAVGGDASQLVRAFVATANQSKGDTAQFACVERALSGGKPVIVNQLLSLIRERRRTGFDATHHSAAFEAAYAPAYRVVRASLADSVLLLARRPAK